MARAGLLKRYHCASCGAVVLRTGGCRTTRCDDCRPVHFSTLTRSYGQEIGMQAVSVAMSQGRLPSPRGLACADCAGPAVEYEHRNYNRPLDVEPICRSCNLMRGPAIPLVGRFERLIAEGRPPIQSRAAILKLIKTLGEDTSALVGMPAYLNVDHWRRLMPMLSPAILRAA